jgi:hypothetical protein
MARDLGMNRKKLGKLANHDQEPWKLPQQEFIVKLYMKRFGRECSETIRNIEETAAAKPTQTSLDTPTDRRRRRPGKVKPYPGS